MKLASKALSLALLSPIHLTQAQECISNGWSIEFSVKVGGKNSAHRSTCNYESILEAYTHQIYEGVTGSEACRGEVSAADDLNAKLIMANVTVESLCHQIYDGAKAHEVPFTDAAKKGEDLHFEKMFFNGRSEWQEEVETLYESEDGTATSVLKEDAEAVRDFYQGVAEHDAVSWPGSLSNFRSSAVDENGWPTCTTSAAMCCWTKDRQAKDNNGNCAKPYDVNCVDKDPADNTNLCYVDTARGSESNEFESERGLLLFPNDNNNGEGAIHCHGLAWSEDVDHASNRYKGNNLFYVSMYDHMYVRGYVKNVPGAPMCGCVEQMPTVSRSDCTEIVLTETIKITYDSINNVLDGKIIDIDIDFNACQGINNRNNDLWAYAARLYYEGEVSNEKFGELGRIITDSGCDDATKYALNTRGLSSGYVHDEDVWTFVAGRDDMEYHDGYGHRALNYAMMSTAIDSVAPYGVLYRICPYCADTHKKIYYRRLTPIPDNFDLMTNLLYRDNNGDGNNVWGVDFSLHSTYDDALSGENAWKCPNGNYNYGAGYPGNCSPSGAEVKGQVGRFNKDQQKNVAFYVNVPEHDLLQVAPTSVIRGRNEAGGVALIDDDSGTIYLTGSGEDIWGSTDDFNYYSQSAVGDQTVSVNLVKQSHIWFDNWSKAGIMFRVDDTPGSPHAMVVLTGSGGVCTYVRKVADAPSHKYGCKFAGTTSALLKLEKRMDMITSFIGTADDSGVVTWSEMYSFEAPYIGEEFNVGLAACSKRWVAMEAKFEDYSVESYFFPSAAPSLSSAPSAFSDSSIDIGNVGIEGAVVTNSAGQFTVTGSGEDIWSRSDQFHYDQHVVSGDVTIEMEVDSFDVAHYWGKGGLMIRDTLAPNSKHFSIFKTQNGNRLVNQWRSCTNCNSGSNDQPRIWAWRMSLKLTKTGNVFEAFVKKLDSDEWTKIGATREMEFTNDYFYVGIAVCSNENNKIATLEGRDFKISGDMYYFPSAAPSISVAPTAYVNSMDIGSVGIEGNAVLSSAGKITVQGSGHDIWGRNDGFHFVKRPAQGDFSVEMLVESFTTNDWWGKGGIMIRDTLATNSMHYSLFMTKSGNSIANQWRSCSNCNSGHNSSPNVKDRNVWLKITKIGNVFEAHFKRVDDTEWGKVGSTKTMNFSSSNFYVGIAVTANDNSRLAELRGSDIVVLPVEPAMS